MQKRNKKLSKDKESVIVAYIPVLHEGYKRFFDNHLEVKDLYILSKETASQYTPLQKDIRALDPEIIKKSLLAWNRFKNIEIIGVNNLEQLVHDKFLIIMPDDEVCRDLKEKYFKKTEVIFDSIFLRWDKHKSSKGVAVEVDQTISIKKSDLKIMDLLRKEADKSSDFWRQIGAAVLKGGKLVLIRHNHAVPSEYMPYVEGDPRSDFHKGVNVELSTVLHAEAGLVADAAKKGISLDGAEMYSTTFPCPPCAKMIAYSGIKKLYYSDGYGVLDAERILKSQDVEIIFVKTN